MVIGAATAALFMTGCANSMAQPHPAAVAKRTVRPTADPARRTLANHQPTSPRRLPRFTAQVSGPLSRRDVRFSWHHGCPVPPGKLRAIHLSYVGFDHRAHMGKIIVNATVVHKVIKVFRTLYQAKFPIRQMRPVDAYHGSDPRSMAADNTSGFNCRLAVAAGPPSWSMHAYGLAIDVNTVQNPYVQGSHVQPKAGAAYLNRSRIRPGMAYPGGVLVKAFSSVGWGWGGNWPGSPDYQHFSSNGS
jgi:hypothetical protein